MKLSEMSIEELEKQRKANMITGFIILAIFIGFITIWAII